MDELNLCLIGMPSAGKSILGRALARKLGRKFLDGDTLIEKNASMPLAKILASLGSKKFMALEEKVIKSIRAQGAVVAPGGSVVLSARTMAHLQKTSEIIYLRVGLARIERRLGNMAGRGVVGSKKDGIKGVYRMRRPLYERYADRTILNLDKSRTLGKLSYIAENMWGSGKNK